jgi:phage gp16-like protein
MLKALERNGEKRKLAEMQVSAFPSDVASG